MNFPDFFDKAPSLTVYDPLAAFLGAVDGGLITYSYSDAVKLAGHSCPTVAGAFLMTVKALERLYEGDVPVRGDIDVELRQEVSEGVAGVMASVAGLLTGAASEGGFKGIAGQFERRDRLHFGTSRDGEISFRRRDTGACVAASVNGGAVPPVPESRALLQRVLSGEALREEAREFGLLWQERVRRMLIEHADDPDFIRLEAVS